MPQNRVKTIRERVTRKASVSKVPSSWRTSVATKKPSTIGTNRIGLSRAATIWSSIWFCVRLTKRFSQPTTNREKSPRRTSKTPNTTIAISKRPKLVPKAVLSRTSWVIVQKSAKGVQSSLRTSIAILHCIGNDQATSYGSTAKSQTRSAMYTHDNASIPGLILRQRCAGTVAVGNFRLGICKRHTAHPAHGNFLRCKQTHDVSGARAR